ncbi:HAD-IA family hydrolase [Liquorilactobacillus capillatus]|uniref:Phosphoglycolate phosphatase n=1 Tax=Liquorilactobacillus capillatus DSM 19910 TaxID=1423731 RepID=A0A0R1M866_9LACO|nr:HAD-IA family hydrolase [Liquorilactobacillus capillatus]KRL01269.1 phosphoglycolate phosphatase [Liquorilactobacillus capillatus DSM 19910]
MTDYFWDFDGTLYNTYPGMVRAFVDACIAYGVKTDHLAVYRIMRQKSLHQAFDLFLTGVDLEKKQAIIKKYTSIEELEQVNAVPFDGAAAICQQVATQGDRNFLVTHRDKSACRLLERDQLKPVFTAYVTSANHFPRKPDPTSLNYLCKQYQVDKTDAFMVGDRELDIVAAQRAGIKGILFDPDTLITSAVRPERRIKHFSELLEKPL